MRGVWPYVYVLRKRRKGQRPEWWARWKLRSRREPGAEILQAR